MTAMIRSLIAAVVLVPGVAFAQVAPEPPPAPADRDPGFVTLDRYDGTSRFGVELSYVDLHNITGGDRDNENDAFRFDLHGQWIDPRTGAGGYLQIPMSYLREIVEPGAPASVTDSTAAIGDVEIGGLYLAVRQPNVALVLHAGVTLPTASSGEDGQLANLAASFARVTDLYLSVPSGLSFRFGASLLVRSGLVFARGDLGVDVNATTDGNGPADTFARANLGVGVELGRTAIMAELASIYDTDSGGGGLVSSWLDTVAVSVRYRHAGVQPYAAIVFPLDTDASNLFVAALTIGVEQRAR